MIFGLMMVDDPLNYGIATVQLGSVRLGHAVWDLQWYVG